MNWLLSTCLLSVMAPPAYLDFSQAGAGFQTDAGSSVNLDHLPSVRLGVLGPGDSALGEEMRVAIQIALDEANSRGGYRLKTPIPGGKEGDPSSQSKDHSIPYEMVFRSDDGLWGVAASQTVSLIYEDQVWAILGALDGQHTHLAELVVSKTWVPVITPTTIDSTVEYANVPWVFRAMPADQQQAELLLKYSRKRGFQRLLLLTEGERESNAALRRIQEAAHHSQLTFYRELKYRPEIPEDILPMLKDIPADAILLWGRTETALPLLQALRRQGIQIPVLAPSYLAMPEVAAVASTLGEIVVAAPCDWSSSSPGLKAFQRKFGERTGQTPGLVAIYSYDVAQMVIRAIEKKGLDRAGIREGLSETNYDGVAGNYHFNSLGGNEASPYLLTLKEGAWGRLEDPQDESKRTALVSGYFPSSLRDVELAGCQMEKRSGSLLRTPDDGKSWGSTSSDDAGFKR
jgi:branched-chain amino acid transport system substrate-binding protein